MVERRPVLRRPRVGLPTAATGGAAATIRGLTCRTRAPRADERGQILVVFVLAMVAIIGMVGPRDRRRRRLSPSGATSRQRPTSPPWPPRTTTCSTTTRRQAIDRAQTIAAANNFTDGVGVDVRQRRHRHDERRRGRRSTIQSPAPELVPRRARDAELARDDVGDRAGRASPTAPAGAAPFIFSIGAFNNDGTPKYQTSTDFGETQRRRPDQRRSTSPGRTTAPATSTRREVRDIIDGPTVIDQDARLRRVHRPAQQRQPHRPVRRRRHVPVAARTCRSRSSTPTATSWAGRCST